MRPSGLSIDLRVDDRMVDMARDGIDIAIRPAPRAATPWWHGTLGEMRRGPTPRRAICGPWHARAPDELHAHRLIGNSGVAALNRWPFRVQGREIVVVAEGQAARDTTGMTAQMALAGLGIARFATLVAEPLVARACWCRCCARPQRRPARADHARHADRAPLLAQDPRLHRALGTVARRWRAQNQRVRPVDEDGVAGVGRWRPSWPGGPRCRRSPPARPQRRIGMRGITLAAKRSSENSRSVMSVSIQPGRMALARDAVARQLHGQAADHGHHRPLGGAIKLGARCAHQRGQRGRGHQSPAAALDHAAQAARAA